jgi:hypothetical protein
MTEFSIFSYSLISHPDVSVANAVYGKVLLYKKINFQKGESYKSLRFSQR